jgi:hypothetical protein
MVCLSCIFTDEYLDIIISRRNDFILNSNPSKRDLSKYQAKLIDEMYLLLQNNKFETTLRDIFMFDDNYINLLLNAFNKELSTKINNKLSVSLYLIDFVIKSDIDYLKSPCLNTNFNIFQSFDEAISVFDLKKTPFIERILNINNSFSFINPIGLKYDLNNIKEFKRDIIIYFTKLINKTIRNKCSKYNNIIIRDEFIITTIIILDSIPLKIIYDSVINFIKLIENDDFDLENEEFINKDSLPSFGQNSDIMILDYDNLINIINYDYNTLKQIMKLSNRNIKSVINNMKFIKDFDHATKTWFINKYSEKGITCHICNMIRNDIKLFQDFSNLDYIYNLLIEINNIIEINSRYLLANIIKIVLSGVIINISLIIIIFLTIENIKNQDIISDILTFSSSIIKCDRCEKIYHYTPVKIDHSDNYLYTRFARYILLKRYVNCPIIKMLSFNCNESIFKYVNSNNLIRQNIKKYYNMTIDVHDNRRDENTIIALRTLLNIDDYGEFIKPIRDEDEEEENPFTKLDNEIEKYKDVLNDDQINSLIYDLFEYARLNLSYTNSIKFFRVIGYDYDLNKYKVNDKDFNPLLDDTINLGVINISGKILLAYIWNFCNLYKSENLKLSLIMSLVNSVQIREYKNKNQIIKYDYAVCNSGKIQNIVVAVLQGRLSLPDGSLIEIDKPTEENNIADELVPSEIFLLIKPYIDNCSIKQPKNANEFFEGLFEYIFDNNISKYIFEIIEIVCVYSETINGFNINHELSIANCYDNMFDTNDYILAIKQIEEFGENHFIEEETDSDSDIDYDF